MDEGEKPDVFVSSIGQRVAIIIEPSEDGGYTAFILVIPGAISEGETPEEAKAMVLERNA